MPFYGLNQTSFTSHANSSWTPVRVPQEVFQQDRFFRQAPCSSSAPCITYIEGEAEYKFENNSGVFMAHVGNLSSCGSLPQLLERRLDNVIYRFGFAHSPDGPANCWTRPCPGQRQTCDIPSYRVTPGDQIELTDSAKEIPLVKEEMESRG